MPRVSRPSWKRVLLAGGAAVVLAGAVLAGTAYALTDVPDPNPESTAGATVITYADGGEMGRVGAQNRISVELDKVPVAVQQAVLAAEDRGHYTDPGISPRGIARALFTNVRGGGVEQGGSSITQQYAKNAFLTQERTYDRKVREVLISLKLSQTVSKDEVLERYLNTIFFGRGASGIEVAAQNYFGKRVDQLTLAEGAVLAASIRSPANYDPERHPERAEQRWRYVLDGMVSQGWLSPSERAGLSYPPVLPASQAGRNNDLSGPKGHIITKVLEELERHGFREEELAGGGLRVQTSIRRAAQAAAEEAVQDVVGDTELHGALVSVKPSTGEVWAYYGGATGTGFDYASQGNGRPAGSSFKPYVLAAALKEGIGLGSRFDGSSPREFPGAEEPVRNFGRRDYGRVDLVRATAESVNTAYYELGLEVGPAKVKELAHAAGIPDSVPLADTATGQVEGGIALGIYDVHVIDQAVGFATFANRGVPLEPFLVKSVRRGDELLYSAQIRPGERAFDEDVAADATYALRQVVQEGTGTRARLASGQQVAGKTGTTSENYDAWFVGYTPQLSTAVWIGTGQNRTIELPGVDEVTGGSVSSGIWRDYMTVALEGQPLERFPPRADTGSTRRGGSGSDSEVTSRPRRGGGPPAPQTVAPSEPATPAEQQPAEPTEPGPGRPAEQPQDPAPQSPVQQDPEPVPQDAAPPQQAPALQQPSQEQPSPQQSALRHPGPQQSAPAQPGEPSGEQRAGD
jgi:membrane peptidoglycan carboxypeptidase